MQTLAGFEGIQGGVQDIWWLPVAKRRRDRPQNHEVLSEWHVEREYTRRPNPGDVGR
jgi:hypothetical protein